MHILYYAVIGAIAAAVIFPSPLKGLGALIGFGLGLWFYFWQKERAGEQQAVHATDRAAERTAQIHAPLRVIQVDGIMRKSGEEFYAAEPAEIISEHSHSTRVGGYGGVSVPIGHGVRVNTGRTRSRTVQSTSVEVDDRGTVYVSNLRMVFVGARHTIDLPLAKIVSLDHFTDGFQVNRTNAKAIVIRTGGIVSAVALARVLAGDRPPTTEAATDRKVTEVAALPPAQSEMQTCPHCISEIPKMASVCRFCQRDVAAV